MESTYFENTSALLCDNLIIIRFRINYIIYNLTQIQLSRISFFLTLDNTHRSSFRNALCSANTPQTMVISEHNSLFAHNHCRKGVANHLTPALTTVLNLHSTYYFGVWFSWFSSESPDQFLQKILFTTTTTSCRFHGLMIQQVTMVLSLLVLPLCWICVCVCGCVRALSWLRGRWKLSILCTIRGTAVSIN